MGPRRIQRGHRRAAHARIAQVDQNQGDLSRHRPSRHHDGHVGHIPVRHRHLDAVDAAIRHACLQGVRAGRVRPFGQREASDDLSARQGGQPARLLGGGARQEDRFGGQVHGRGEWSGSQAASQLLRDHTELEISIARPAERLGDGRPRPCHLHHAAPEVGVVGHVCLEHAAHARRCRPLAEELARLIAQEQLFFGEIEVHRVSSGVPMICQSPRRWR